MSDDITWTLHVEGNATATITATAIESVAPLPEIGTEITVTLWFYGSGPAAGYGESYGSAYGGIAAHIGQYRKLWPFLDAPKGAVDRRGMTDDETPWFRERYGEEFPVDSLLMAVEPGEDTIDSRGWWGLLVDAADDSNIVTPAGARTVELTWFVLAPLEEFDDHDEVRDAFADEVLG